MANTSFLMFALAFVCFAANADIGFDPIEKCYQSEKGCSAFEIINSLIGGYIPEQEIIEFVDEVKSFATEFVTPNVTIDEILDNQTINEGVDIFRNLSRTGNIFYAEPEDEEFTELAKEYKEFMEKKDKFAKIASTKVIPEKKIKEFLNKFPSELSKFKNEMFIDIFNLPLDYFFDAIDNITKLLEQKGKVLPLLEMLFDIPEKELSDLIISIREPIVTDKYSNATFEKIEKAADALIEKLDKIYDEVPENFDDIVEWVNKTYTKIAEIPSIQDIALSFSQLLDSLIKNRDDWKEFIEVPEKDLIEKIKTEVDKVIKDGISIKMALTWITEDEKISDILINSTKAMFDKNATLRSFFVSMIGEEAVKKFDDLIAKLTSDTTTIKQFFDIMAEYNGSVREPYKIFKEFIEDFSSGKEISQYRIFDNDKEAAKEFNNFIKELQTNFSSLYNEEFSLSELFNISEEIKELYTIFKENKTIDQLLKDYKAPEFLSDMIFLVKDYREVTVELYAYSSEVPIIHELLNITIELEDLMIELFEYLQTENPTIKDILDSLPFEDANQVYPALLDTLNLLQSATTLKEICTDIADDMKPIFEFDIAKAANGFIEMKSYTVHNFMYLFVDDNSEVDKMLKELKDAAIKLDNEPFHKLADIFGFNKTQLETLQSNYKEVMEFQYIKDMIEHDQKLVEVVDYITEVMNKAERKYTLAEFDEILDEAIKEATGVDRQAQKNEDNNQAVVIGCSVTGAVVGVSGIAAGAFFVFRKKSLQGDEYNEMKLDP